MNKAKQTAARLEALNTFLSQTPPERLSRNLRNLLLEHLQVQPDGHSFNLGDLLNDMLNLFDFLEEIE